MANKKKESELKHDVRITLRLTEEEFMVLKEDALQAKMSAAAYAREIVTQRNVTLKYMVVADIRDIRTLGRELNSIGNNLNQIAQYFHTGGSRSEMVLQEIHEGVAELKRIRTEMEKVVGEMYGDH